MQEYINKLLRTPYPRRIDFETPEYFMIAVGRQEQAMDTVEFLEVLLKLFPDKNQQ